MERAVASSRWATVAFLRAPSSPKSRPVATRAPSTGVRRAVNWLFVVAGGEVALDVPVGRPARTPSARARARRPGGSPRTARGRRTGPALTLRHSTGRDLVAVEAVEDAAGLLGVDQPGVEVAGVVDRALDGLLGDLVEHHPLDRHLGLEHLEQVPGDGLALAVLIGGEEELVGVLEEPLELGDLLLLVGVDDVVGLEAVVDVDAEPAERALLDLGGHLRGVGMSRMWPTDASTS